MCVNPKKLKKKLLKLSPIFCLLLHFFATACPDIEIAHGTLAYSGESKQMVKFECDIGYVPFGECESTCIDGKWTPPPPECGGNFLLYLKGKPGFARKIFDEKSRARSCFELRYFVNGGTVGTVRIYLKLEHEDWDLEPSSAVFESEISEKDLGRFSYSFHSLRNYDKVMLYGEVRSHKGGIIINYFRIIEACAEEHVTPTPMKLGYGSIGHERRNDVWCTLGIIVCPALKLRNGRLRYRQRGRFVKFICNTGFMLAGDRFSTCSHGVWDGAIPKCVRAACKKVNFPPNGLIYPSHMGAVLSFFCKPEYTLRGSSIAYCDGMKWDTNLPTCLKTGTKPQLSCDFESEDICGWSHDVNHDFDWTRMNQATPSGGIGTGPTYDHTKGFGKNGYYMYIESSSRNEGDVARLVSPVYDKTDSRSCFEFYYHMFGATIGSLRVYLKFINDSWNLDTDKAIFNVHGEQGNRWLRFIYPFESTTVDYQIIIEGVRGNGYVSDIAIDDVRIIENCTYTEEYDTTTSSFELGESSTTEDATKSSCENRCFIDNDMTTDPSNCLCVFDCFHNYSCCADFVYVCLVNGVTQDTDEESSSTTETLISTTNYNVAIGNTSTVLNTVENNTSDRVPSTRMPDTTSTPSSTSTTAKTTTMAAKPTSKSLTERHHLTSNSTLPTVVTSTMSTEKNLTHHSETTAHQITTRKAVIPTLKPSTKSQQTPKSVKESKIVYVKPTSPPLTSTQAIVDVAVYTTDLSNEVPVIPPEEIATDFDVDFDDNKVESLKENLTSDEKSKTVVYLIVTGGVVVILALLLYVGFVKRNKLLTFFNIKNIRKSGHGDSQSDVRFLTSDEIVDFSLAGDEYSGYSDE